MSRISFNVAAKCDKAGRAQNQDNYWVCPDLTHLGGSTSDIGNDHDFELSRKGALLVVADGMGGMKSGEKASEYVIEGIKTRFANIPDSILTDDNAIIDFIKTSIVKADRMVKDYAADHRESEGMGSTIVLVWLLGEKAYCGWVGDSRIYCYNPQNSLVRLSHDHSYVQSLVDEGKISEDEAFDHPDSNIITRSIGDSGENVNPETKIYPIHRRDVFLLCSDGLCGLLPDSKIEEILSDNCTSSADALRALWAKGESEGFDDNCTVEVACVTDGGVAPSRKWAGYDEGRPKPVMQPRKSDAKGGASKVSKPGLWQANRQYIILLLCVLLVGGGVYWFFSRSGGSESSDNRDYFFEQNDGDDDNLSSDNRHDNDSRHDSDNPDGKTRRDDPRKDRQQTDRTGNTAQSNNATTNQSSDNNTNQQTAEAINGANNAGNDNKTVSPEYKSLLDNTFNSVQSVMSIVNVVKRVGIIDNRQYSQLKNFHTNVASLKNRADQVKLLDGEEKSKYNTIINTGKSVDDILKASNNNRKPKENNNNNSDGNGGNGGDGTGNGGGGTTNVSAAVSDPIYND